MDTFYVSLTVNCEGAEFDHIVPKAYSLDEVFRAARILYPKATSMVLSVVPDILPTSDKAKL